MVCDIFLGLVSYVLIIALLIYLEGRVYDWLLVLSDSLCSVLFYELLSIFDSLAYGLSWIWYASLRFWEVFHYFVVLVYLHY